MTSEVFMDNAIERFRHRVSDLPTLATLVQPGYPGWLRDPRTRAEMRQFRLEHISHAAWLRREHFDAWRPLTRINVNYYQMKQRHAQELLRLPSGSDAKWAKHLEFAEERRAFLESYCPSPIPTYW